MADAREASPHQNAGSRMGLAVFETNLHEIGFKRGERALEPATERGHGLARGGGPRRRGAGPRAAAGRRPGRSLPPPQAFVGGGGYFPEMSKGWGRQNPPPPGLTGWIGFAPP